MSERNASRAEAKRWWRIEVLGLALALALAVLGLQLVAHSAFMRSTQSSRPIEARLEDARLARTLAPWNRSYRSGAALLEGRSLYEDDQLDEAKSVLKAAYLEDRENTGLRQLLREVNLAIQVRDARKAHLQHGHEGSGGTLEPEEVER